MFICLQFDLLDEEVVNSNSPNSQEENGATLYGEHRNKYGTCILLSSKSSTPAQKYKIPFYKCSYDIYLLKKVGWMIGTECV